MIHRLYLPTRRNNLIVRRAEDAPTAFLGSWKREVSGLSITLLFPFASVTA
jgi:hypothetical protein